MQANITVLNDSNFYNSAVTKDGSKVAKLSTFDSVQKKASALMSEVRVQESKEEKTPEEPAVAAQEIATPTEETKEEVATPAEETTKTTPEPTVTSEPKAPTELPLTSEEVLRAKKDLLGITAYSDIEATISPIESIQSVSRRLKTNPVVPGNINRERNTNGINHEKVEPEVSNKVTEEKATFDFGALPGVEEPSNEESFHTEQDDRLNEYLNRSNSVENSDEIKSELDEIRKLKAELEEAKSSLVQVKANVGDLQKKDSAISEQLALYKKQLMEERDNINAELVDQTREWNDLTQLVRAKEALMDNNTKTM